MKDSPLLAAAKSLWNALEKKQRRLELAVELRKHVERSYELCTMTATPGDKPMQTQFQKELAELINRYCAENGSDTPDFVLAQYLDGCLGAWNDAIASRERFYGRTIGQLFPNPDPNNVDPGPRR